jgi:hypothetical protein
MKKPDGVMRRPVFFMQQPYQNGCGAGVITSGSVPLPVT